MAVLSGHTRTVGYAPAAPVGVPGPSATGPSPSTTIPSIIDGTPVRVVVLALSAAVGLVALHAAGFRFSLGVSA